MKPDDTAPGSIRREGDSAFDQYGMEARIEARLLDHDKPVTPEQREALIQEIKEYRANNGRAVGVKMPWDQLSSKIGVSGSTLVEIVRGKYKADPDNIFRKVDQFLADERIRNGRFDSRSFAKINLTQIIMGAIAQGLKHNTIPVIIGEPGSGKSQHARWFVGQREGAVLIEPDDADCDETWVIDALYKALRLYGRNHRGRRMKKRAIVDYLVKHKNTVIVVDEAQKLKRPALEMLRRLHDKSDPQGARNVCIILFGDRDFHRLIVRTCDGSARTPISPQITRRLYPVLDINVDACQTNDHGAPIAGTVYITEDIEAITRNQRLRVIKSDREMKWLVRLANTHCYGSLGMAMRVLGVAWDHHTGKVEAIILFGNHQTSRSLCSTLPPNDLIVGIVFVFEITHIAFPCY